MSGRSVRTLANACPIGEIHAPAFCAHGLRSLCQQPVELLVTRESAVGAGRIRPCVFENDAALRRRLLYALDEFEATVVYDRIRARIFCECRGVLALVLNERDVVAAERYGVGGVCQSQLLLQRLPALEECVDVEFETLAVGKLFELARRVVIVGERIAYAEYAQFFRRRLVAERGYVRSDELRFRESCARVGAVRGVEQTAVGGIVPDDAQTDVHRTVGERIRKAERPVERRIFCRRRSSRAGDFQRVSQVRVFGCGVERRLVATPLAAVPVFADVVFRVPWHSRTSSCRSRMPPLPRM